MSEYIWTGGITGRFDSNGMAVEKETKARRRRPLKTIDNSKIAHKKISKNAPSKGTLKFQAADLLGKNWPLMQLNPAHNIISCQ